MKESALRTKIKKALIRVGGFWVVIHQAGYQQKGLPDLIGCPDKGPFAHWFHGLEIKVPGKESTLTDRQKYTLRSIRATGGRGTVCTTVWDALDFVYRGIDPGKEAN